MTVTIELPPEIEAGLAHQASAQGLPISEIVQRLLSELFPNPVIPEDLQARTRRGHQLPPEEWVKRFEAWVASHTGNSVVLPDAAMERESIYDDHGR